jgi:hypothetical protein
MNDSFSGKGELYYSKKYRKSKYEKNIDAFDEKGKNPNFINEGFCNEKNEKSLKNEKKVKVENKAEKGEDGDEITLTDAREKADFSRLLLIYMIIFIYV